MLRQGRPSTHAAGGSVAYRGRPSPPALPLSYRFGPPSPRYAAPRLPGSSCQRREAAFPFGAAERGRHGRKFGNRPAALAERRRLGGKELGGACTSTRAPRPARKGRRAAFSRSALTRRLAAVRNKLRYGPLHSAAHAGHVDVARLLLDHGADMEAKIAFVRAREMPPLERAASLNALA